MPRMPKPDYTGNATNNTQNTTFIPKPSLSHADSNIKIVLLEDKLREDLAPKNLLLLDETFKIPKDSYIYIFDRESTSNKLKRISSENIKSTILNQVGQKIEVENILGYSFVSTLPDKGQAKVNTIYIVPTEGRSGTRNMYDEYLFIKEKNEYEKLGNIDTDLSEYRPREEQDLINKALEDLILTKLQEHKDDFNNPHHVTKEQLGVHDDPELVFKNHYEFPNIGKKGLLYIATDEQITYYYDGTKFVAIKGDVPDITYIDCGGAN